MADYTELIERIMDAYDFETFLELMCDSDISAIVRFANREGLNDVDDED